VWEGRWGGRCRLSCHGVGALESVFRRGSSDVDDGLGFAAAGLAGVEGGRGQSNVVQTV